MKMFKLLTPFDIFLNIFALNNTSKNIIYLYFLSAVISGFAGGNVLCAYCQRLRGPCGCQGLCVGGCGGGFGRFGSSLGPALGSPFSPAFGSSTGLVSPGGRGFPFLSYGAFPYSRFSQFGGGRSAGVSLGSRFLSRNFQGGGGNMDMFGNSADYDHDD